MGCDSAERPRALGARGRPACKRYVQLLHGRPLHAFVAPVVARRRRHLGVATQLLDGGDGLARLEQLRDEGPPRVVRRELRHLPPRTACSTSTAAPSAFCGSTIAFPRSIRIPMLPARSCAPPRAVWDCMWRSTYARRAAARTTNGQGWAFERLLEDGIGQGSCFPTWARVPIPAVSDPTRTLVEE